MFLILRPKLLSFWERITVLYKPLFYGIVTLIFQFFQQDSYFSCSTEKQQTVMGLMMLLSPAKTLDFSDNRANHFTEPRLIPSTKELVQLLQKKQTADLMALMSISEKLGTLNYERYQDFSFPFTEENAKQAILAFKGDVYTGLEAAAMSEADLHYAQDHLRILSGLYGLLRPLDLMQAYRLEMGTKLKNKRGKNLYEFWGATITELLNEDLVQNKTTAVLNLASREYFSAIQPKKLQAPLIDVDFKENRDGKLKIIAFNAKKARGAMANQVIRGQIDQIDDLRQLNVEGYQFEESVSTPDHLVFTK